MLSRSLTRLYRERAASDARSERPGRRWQLGSQVEDQAIRRDLTGGQGFQRRELAGDGRLPR